MPVTRISLHFDVSAEAQNAVKIAAEAIAEDVAAMIERRSKAILENVMIGIMYEDGEESIEYMHDRS